MYCHATAASDSYSSAEKTAVREADDKDAEDDVPEPVLSNIFLCQDLLAFFNSTKHEDVAHQPKTTTNNKTDVRVPIIITTQAYVQIESMSTRCWRRRAWLSVLCGCVCAMIGIRKPMFFFVRRHVFLENAALTAVFVVGTCSKREVITISGNYWSKLEI